MSKLGKSCVRIVMVLLLAVVLAGGISLLASAGHCPRYVYAQGTDVIVTIDEVDMSAFPAMRVRVSVRDRNGVPIPDLMGDHFEMIEDGASVFQPTSVNTDSNPQAQVSLAIVIDMYRTLQGPPIEAAQEATNNLLNELLEQEDDSDRAAFVGVHRGLSTDPKEINEEYEVPFTNDRNRLLNVINFLHERIETSGSGTPLYDAVIKAVRLAGATEPVGHRAVIVMTDGEDRDSISTDSDTIQSALNQRTPVFTIGLSNSRLNEQYLRRLADQTGGAYQAAEKPDDFSPLFANVLTVLRTQYILTYDSGLPEDGQPHSLLVHVRTPTQMEGFQEQRIETPRGEEGGGQGSGGEGSGEEGGGDVAPVEQEATPVPESEAATPVPPAEELDIIGTVQDFIQDNLLLTILVIAAIGLLFLILVIVIIIIIRRRGQVAADEALPPLPEAPLYPPSYEAPAPDLSAPTDRPMGATERPGAEFPGASFGPTPTIAAGGIPSMETRPSSPVAPPPPPPPFAEPAAFQPAPPAEPEVAPAGGTRIMKREPKMAVVGLLIDQENPGRRFDVAKLTIVVGRTQRCDVVIDHATVSRQHATIKLEGDQFRLYDLGSSNGTFVGEQRVREPVTLQDGSIVRFGAVPFIFKIVSLTS